MNSLLLLFQILLYPSLGWVTPSYTRKNVFYRCKNLSPLFALADDYKQCGEQIIYKAGELCGIHERENLTVEWKADRIIVTVCGSVYVSNPDENEDDSEPNGDAENERNVSGVDITELARAINHAFGEDEVGLEIAENYEIEVTTPGASDELSGIMFESYKGFDVTCRYEDPKAKKGSKEIQGRLVERNDLVTIINIKGRMKKIKNELVLYVKLPKAKKEKGVK